MNLNKVISIGCLIILFTFLQFNSYGQTQLEMNLEAAKNYEKADRELNLVYKRILKEYASQPIFIKKFKAAQRLWLQLRDAEVAAKFPGPDY